MIALVLGKPFCERNRILLQIDMPFSKS